MSDLKEIDEIIRDKDKRIEQLEGALKSLSKIRCKREYTDAYTELLENIIIAIGALKETE